MAALLAQIRADLPIADERSAARRTLRLLVSTESARDEATDAWVHNLSETGMLLETGVELQVGQQLRVELPHAGATAATVVWIRGNIAGCVFSTPISKATISAALLRARPEMLPAAAANSPDEWRAVRREQRVDHETDASRVVLFISLLMGLTAATLLVIALLTFPFFAFVG